MKALDLYHFWGIVLFIIGVILVSWLISRIIRYFITRHMRRKRGEEYTQTSTTFLKNSVKFIVGIIGFTFIIISVPAFREKADYIFSGAGILAAILGFAAQSALSNLIAGAFIVIFKPFRVDDYIRLDEKRYGIVEDINLRHTVIRNFENKRIIIPNSVISVESILNHTIKDLHVLSHTHFEIGLYGDIDLAKKIITEEALQHPSIIDNRTPEEVLRGESQIRIRLISIQGGTIQFRLYAWVSSPSEEFQFRCDMLERVHKRFRKEGIELPKYLVKQE
ncbi:MAG: mechanosensitive ion channel family protein [Flavobacteriaceae bacterium]|nr:mechanosensitive ion channel family protein [Flavobacteriaceae bacterium]